MVFTTRNIAMTSKSKITDVLAGRFALSCLFSLSVLVLCSAETGAAQGYKAEKINASPPQELSAAVRETLSGDALRVIGPNGPLCEIWLRKVVPAKTTVTEELGISFGQLAEGTLIAAVRFPSQVRDYRRQRVKPGVYTLRYALVPVDGNHSGVAPQRDFLLAAPATADPSPANITRDEALNLSRKTTGTNHPSVWSIAAGGDAAGAVPTLNHQEDGDLWLLELRVQVQRGGEGAPTPAATVAMRMVVVGFAPEA